ncbi:L-seryl-tRNA(Sec) selenium transferase [Geodia barretti]|uniref:L-seryl-tRNA(Sec) selenium transferase n=1 Tax=Geodia barretti TaxID=519541 RepID=A0AA35T7D7_GEOBA|nr:L-seryl-tRNA(Sec) selenium transferase [Geodia barretti]
MSFFSGDKLLGGPQAGIIAGDKALVDTVSRHPLARAMRIDKLSMAALAATLEHYIRDEALDKVPIWRMIAMPADEVRARVKVWAEKIGEQASPMKAQSTIGGGSLPGETLPTWALAIECDGVDGGAEVVARRLREADNPVLGRIEDGRVLLDARTVLPDEDDALLKAVQSALHGQE